MTALLEVPAIRQHAKRFSVKEYQRMTEGQPTELLRGVILEKMSKSPIHFDTIEALREVIAPQLQPGRTLRQEGPLTLQDSEPEPDLAIVRGKRQDFHLAHPTTAELVIEVAVTSLEIDRVKALIFAEAGVREYWIVRPADGCVEVFREPTAEGYTHAEVVAAPAVLISTAVENLQVDLGPLFA